MGQRLRELRLRRGLQQSEVARRLKISPAYLSLIEKGKRVVQLPLLFQALEASVRLKIRIGFYLNHYLAQLFTEHLFQSAGRLRRIAGFRST